MDPYNFSMRVVTLMDRLNKEFKTSELDEAAIVGNLAHECAGFTQWHEVGQPPDRGGIGLAMWTGPRRRLYENFCTFNKLDPMTFNAGVEYLVHELRMSYRGALRHMMATRGLPQKVAVFERYYEGAGIVHEASRLAWAEKALATYNAKHPAVTA